MSNIIQQQHERMVSLMNESLADSNIPVEHHGFIRTLVWQMIGEDRFHQEQLRSQPVVEQPGLASHDRVVSFLDSLGIQD